MDYTKINANKTFCNDLLYQKVSEELNIDINLVKDIVNVQSLTAVENVTNGPANIIFKSLGKIKVKYWKSKIV